MSAALPSRPMDRGWPLSRAAVARLRASSRSSRLLVQVAELDPPLMRVWSHSTQMTTPPFIVTASGWAPPMPPSPAVRAIVPRSVPPKRLAAIAAKVS